MANKFSNSYYINNVSISGTYTSGSTTATDRIISNTDGAVKIGSSASSTTITAASAINFYIKDTTGTTSSLNTVISEGKLYVHPASTVSDQGFRIKTNDSGTLANHNILIYDADADAVEVGTTNENVLQTIVYSKSNVSTPDGIHMIKDKHIFGIGSSTYNSTKNIFDTDVAKTHLCGMGGDNTIYIGYQKMGETDATGRSASGRTDFYGKYIRFYVGSTITFQCTDTEVQIPSGTKFMLQGEEYGTTSLSFTANSTNVSSISGSIKVIKSLGIVVCTIQPTMKIAYSANTNYAICTISDTTYVPTTVLAPLNAVGYNASGSAVAKGTAWITTGGVINYKQRVAGAASHTIAITGCWFYKKTTADPDDI